MHPGAHMPAQQHRQSLYFMQEASGAAGSSCGGCSSPQASCDTAAAAAKAHQFWSTQQYDAAYNLMLAHSPVVQYPAAPMNCPYGTSAGMGVPGAPCAGPCCVPGTLLPHGSGSVGAGSVACMAPAHMDYPHGAQGVTQGYTARYPNPAGAFGNAATPAAAGMVPHAALGSTSMARQHSETPAGLLLAPQHSLLQPTMLRAHSGYPPVRGGVQKKFSASAAAAGSKPSAAAAAEGRAARKSADGSCSSKDGSPAPLPKARRTSKGSCSAAAVTAATGSGSAGRSRTSSSVVAPAAAAAVAASGPTATLIKELQQEVSSFWSACSWLAFVTPLLVPWPCAIRQWLACCVPSGAGICAHLPSLKASNLQQDRRAVAGGLATCSVSVQRSSRPMLQQPFTACAAHNASQ
jgi:hypothetical protein